MNAAANHGSPIVEGAARLGPAARAIVVMGVSGCGKTSVGVLLARQLGWRFIDADDHHPPANVQKMRGGTPLTDEDRAPWLAALNAMLRQSGSGPTVLACSALRQRYRDTLAEGVAGIVFVHLAGSMDLIGGRIAARKHEYMPASLLASQFHALEPPADSVRIDVRHAPQAIAHAIAERIGQLGDQRRTGPGGQAGTEGTQT
jgi:gluconokinase